MLRIAIGGIAHETNTFNTLPTGLEAFHIQRDKDLLKDDAVKTLLESGIDVIPTVYATAPPSGLIEKDAYFHLKEKLLGRIETVGRLDGICLLLHGAMEVEDVGDGEKDLVNGIRQVVGEDVIISASLDLHGNIVPELAKSVDILTAYRTAPHVDVTETKVRAALLLAKCIRSRTRPISTIVRLPLLLPGEMAVTSTSPALELYRKLREINRSRCVFDSSLLVGMAWADSPKAGGSVIVVAENKDCLDKAYKKACHLAREYWSKRHEFHLDAPSGSIDDVIKTAKSYPGKPVFISDSGDNVTGGAAGDIPLLIERLIALDVEDAVVGGILDPSAVSLCKHVGAGHGLKVEIGGKLDRVNGYPFEIEGKVVSASGEGAVVRSHGVDVILTAHWQAFVTLDSFKSYSIDPLERKIVVVKQGYLFPELRRIAAFHLMALSPGCTNLRLDELEYMHVRRPICPLDRDFSWDPSFEVVR